MRHAEPRASAEGETGGEESEQREIAAHTRSLRNSLITLVVFCALVAGLLLGVPSLRSVADRIGDASAGWIAVGIGFEVLSCAGYVTLFVLIFGKLGRHLGTRLSLSELAVNAVVSAGGVGGIVLGAWVLRSKGLSIEEIARRSVVLFFVTSAVNVFATLLIGLGMGISLLPGTSNPLLTLLPAGAAFSAIFLTIGIACWAAMVAEGRARGHARLALAMRAFSAGVFDTLRLLRSANPRLLGAVGYWLFDTLTLYVCLIAYGRTPSFAAVALAYLVGMLANSIPIPGGFVVVEGGLVGMLLLFDVRPATLVLAAVLTYRAIALWVPAIIGSLAFISMRREIGKPLKVEPSSVAQAHG